MGASNEDREGFAEREEFQRLLEEHIKRINERRPEHGDYEQPFKKNEIEGAYIDFDRQAGRDEKVIDSDSDQEGDVLILDPDKLQQKLPDIKFEKQLGRPEQEIDEMDD